MLELFDGYTVEMRQLNVRQMADLDAYVRGKFIKNTLEAVKELDPLQEDRIIRNLALAAQQIALLIGNRDDLTKANDGKLHFRDADEFRAWYEARQKAETTDAASSEKIVS